MDWQMLPYQICEFSKTLEVIEDALCFGFEFKVENHTIYFREREN